MIITCHPYHVGNWWLIANRKEFIFSCVQKNVTFLCVGISLWVSIKMIVFSYFSSYTAIQTAFVSRYHGKNRYLFQFFYFLFLCSIWFWLICLITSQIRFEHMFCTENFLNKILCALDIQKCSHEDARGSTGPVIQLIRRDNFIRDYLEENNESRFSHEN